MAEEVAPFKAKAEDIVVAVSAPPIAPQNPSTVAQVVRKKRTPKQKISAQILEDTKIEAFFKGREKDPQHYTYTPEGHLQIRGVKGVADQVIRFPYKFQPMTEAMYAEAMEERTKELDSIEKDFESAIATLRIVMEQYKSGTASADLVVAQNAAVLEVVKRRSKAAYPERWIDILERPVIKDILMMVEPFEKRKMEGAAYLLKHHELSRKQAWGTYVARTSGGGQEEEGAPIRIRFLTDINDPDNGHFHPFTQRNFVFNETEYCCPVQAYEAERFKELGKEDLRKQVLGTRSGRTIHSIAIKDKALPNQPQKLWEDILFHFFQQHPELRKELDATGTEKFHVMDKEVPAEYGQALEMARLRLRELADKDVDHQEIKERAITEDEQKKAKVGAIVANFKKKF